MKRLAEIKVLVVEDDVIIGQDLRALLEDAGAQVVGPATTAQGALEMLLKGPIDGALLDVKLGRGGSSTDVAAALRRRRLPFIVVTGYDGETIPAPLRGVPCLPKPFTAAALYDVVHDTFRPSSPAAA